MKNDPKTVKSGVIPNKMQRRPNAEKPKPVMKPLKKPMPRGK